MKTLICNRCKKELPIDNFNIDKSKKTGRQTRCKMCNKEMLKKWYNENKKIIYEKHLIYRRNKKQMALDYKGNKCSLCGYNKCVDVLQFHHLNPKEKEFEFKEYRYLSLDKMKKELDKCIVVCANCHGEIHYKKNRE